MKPMALVRSLALPICLGGALVPLDGYATEPVLKRGIVNTVIHVDVALVKKEPPNLLITATEQVSTAGCTGAQLEWALYDKPSADGIQDCYLTEVRSTGTPAQVVSKIHASNRWEDLRAEAPWLKVVRIHGVGDGVVVKMLAPVTGKAAARQFEVGKGDKMVLTIKDEAGPVIGTALPPSPCWRLPQHGSLSTSAHDLLSEEELKAILDQAKRFDDYLARLRVAGAQVQQALPCLAKAAR